MPYFLRSQKSLKTNPSEIPLSQDHIQDTDTSDDSYNPKDSELKIGDDYTSSEDGTEDETEDGSEDETEDEEEDDAENDAED